MLDCLQMGCLPSRSTTVSPADTSASSSERMNKKRNGPYGASDNRSNSSYRQTRTTTTHRGHEYGSVRGELVNVGTSFDKDVDEKEPGMADLSRGEPEDDIMSILMAGQEREPAGQGGESGPDGRKQKVDAAEDGKLSLVDTFDEGAIYSPSTIGNELEREGDPKRPPNGKANENNRSMSKSESPADSRENSFDDDLNMDLLRVYIAVDYEITQLEDKDALRIYHEKIEQLEQLERELDMISSEVEEVAARNEMDLSQLERFHSPHNERAMNQAKADLENNSMLSGMTSTLSPKSSIRAGKQRHHNERQALLSHSREQSLIRHNGATGMKSNNRTNEQEHSVDNINSNNQTLLAPYSTIEGVFNRKILLEKERDKLKKEVELVIIECDKLQQKYKKRDEILDKLFDGRTGNGLENHLEQQLNWLMEQKHYVDQVFYAWKRAETLISQTCEQFASASELLKRLLKLDDQEQRSELSKNIAQLLTRSRQDMEQAQKYNPNVDAPFFTDAETERFHKIIETISQPQTLTQSDYSQIATVIQFAYKRAVSIRLWLEQILQITIARDSFELAEEYKWIAIQLRKERITLINSKLTEPAYRGLAQTIREQIASNQKQQHQQSQLEQQQQQQQQKPQQGSGNAAAGPKAVMDVNGNKSEINRDSGVESDDIDIEEEIYRLLEMNKSRLEAAIAMQRTNASANNNPTGGLAAGAGSAQTGESYNQRQRDEMMRERIKRRLGGEQPLALDGKHQSLAMEMSDDHDSLRSAAQSADTTPTGVSTPSKLRVELDEASRQNLLSK